MAIGSSYTFLIVEADGKKHMPDNIGSTSTRAICQGIWNWIMAMCPKNNEVTK